MISKFVLLADAVNASVEGKLNIAGEFNSIFSDQIPIAYPFFVVVARIEANAGEGLDHAAQFRITDDDGKKIVETPPFPMKFAKAAPGMPVRANVLIQMAGVVFPRHGDYTVHILVDGVQRDETTMYVRKASEQPRRGQ
jgi:hypothetical protein